MGNAVAEREDRIELAELLDEKDRRVRQNALANFIPYSWQKKFFSLGTNKPQRLLMAANRVGKTFCGAVEMAYHLTGRYPDWWTGRRFTRAIQAWAGSNTAETTRDGAQKTLFGDPGNPAELGTGTVPRKYIGYTPKRHGVDGALAFVLVKHVSGQWSKIQFKSYDQGREKWQVAGVDAIWFDEEPPDDIYGEGITRTLDLQGLTILTFTPLKGMSDVVRRYIDPNSKAGGQAVVNATWTDAPHLDAKTQGELLESIPLYQREARSKGIPALGSGKIYPVAEEVFLIKPIEIPQHWPRLFALDVGWRRTAVIWGAHDRETDTIYLYSEHYRGEAEVPIHASAIRGRGAWIPGVIDPAANGRSVADGEAVIDLYKGEGLDLKSAINTVEAGIFEVWKRLSTGRLKVFSSLANWLNEFRLYHRDEKGRVAKKDDHLMDASRYLVMGIRGAMVEPFGVPALSPAAAPDKDGFYW
jgi:phage terminase large subunit-like protein